MVVIFSNSLPQSAPTCHGNSHLFPTQNVLPPPQKSHPIMVSGMQSTISSSDPALM